MSHLHQWLISKRLLLVLLLSWLLIGSGIKQLYSMKVICEAVPVPAPVLPLTASRIVLRRALGNGRDNGDLSAFFVDFLFIWMGDSYCLHACVSTQSHNLPMRIWVCAWGCTVPMYGAHPISSLISSWLEALCKLQSYPCCFLPRPRPFWCPFWFWHHNFINTSPINKL